MRHTTRPLLLSSLLLALLPQSLAQSTSSGVLQTPNSPLPACASSCQILQQAATACGGLTASSQNIWVCFCQSAYLTTLYQSGEGTCADTCATSAERDTLRVWYNQECGTDKGFSEHQGQGQGQGTTTVVLASTSSSAAAGATGTSGSGTGGTSGGSVTSGISQGQSGGWFKLHWKWILMLILLFVLLLLIALAAVWWKRRHDRKQDLISSSFNPGITSRSVPGPGHSAGPGPGAGPGYGDGRGPEMGMADPGHHGSGSVLGFDGGTPQRGAGAGVQGGAAAGMAAGSASGRHTPTRTRDAFMPYGYGYARSESRHASQSYVDQSDTITSVGDSARGAEAGRGVGESGYAGEVAEGSAKKGKGRVLVRERDAR
ncbi:hypothetical protein LTR95_000651 [Oleoguttula sp. CCFEE 5521]